MSLPSAPIDPTLDPITGLPVGQVYVPQYQLPLASQPVNLSELNAQGKQSQWLYPDNLPPVLARLQARDLTNPGNAQDLSTDGKRNLNVNIAAGSSNNPLSIPYVILSVENTSAVNSGNYNANFSKGIKIQSFNYALSLPIAASYTDMAIWVRFFAFDQNNGSKYDIMVDEIFINTTLNIYKPYMHGHVIFNPLLDILGALSPNQVSPLVFGFQLGGAGGVQLVGGFDLYYADM